MTGSVGTLGLFVAPMTGFVAAFGLTLVLLVVVVATGLRAKRKVHITSVALLFGALALTIYYAYGLGRIYDLERAGWITPVHLALAKVSTAALLVVAISGVCTLLRPATRRLHGRLAFVTIGLTVITAITGVWMLWLAPRVAG